MFDDPLEPRYSSSSRPHVYVKRSICTLHALERVAVHESNFLAAASLRHRRDACSTAPGEMTLRRALDSLVDLRTGAASCCPSAIATTGRNGLASRNSRVSSESAPAVRDSAPRIKNLLAPRLQSPIFPDQSPISNQPPAGTPISNFQCPSWAI